MSATNCPNCGHKLKGGFLSTTAEPMEQVKVDIINEFAKEKKEGYCYSCGLPLFLGAVEKLKNELNNLNAKLINCIQNMLVVSIPQPLGWDFRSLGIVTGQLVIGTGVLSEISQTITDIIGGTSNNLKAKLQQGEQSCITQLKLQTEAMGGNAIVGVDIDYAELGASKGMIMVCMTGTAVKVNNLQQVTDMDIALFDQAVEIKKDIKRIKKLIATTGK